MQNFFFYIFESKKDRYLQFRPRIRTVSIASSVNDATYFILVDIVRYRIDLLH